jgi:hypothetical protein
LEDERRDGNGAQCGRHITDDAQPLFEARLFDRQI